MDLAYDSAFPVPGMPPVGTGDPRDGMAGGCEPQPGISVRAYMAAAALQSLHGRSADIFTASLRPPTHKNSKIEAEYCQKRINDLAQTAVAIADALIAELKK